MSGSAPSPQATATIDPSHTTRTISEFTVFLPSGVSVRVLASEEFHAPSLVHALLRLCGANDAMLQLASAEMASSALQLWVCDSVGTVEGDFPALDLRVSLLHLGVSHFVVKPRASCDPTLTRSLHTQNLTAQGTYNFLSFRWCVCVCFGLSFPLFFRTSFPSGFPSG